MEKNKNTELLQSCAPYLDNQSVKAIIENESTRNYSVPDAAAADVTMPNACNSPKTP